MKSTKSAHHNFKNNNTNKATVKFSSDPATNDKKWLLLVNAERFEPLQETIPWKYIMIVLYD